MLCSCYKLQGRQLARLQRLPRTPRAVPVQRGSADPGRDLLRNHRRLIDAGFTYDQATTILEVLSSRCSPSSPPVDVSMQRAAEPLQAPASAEQGISTPEDANEMNAYSNCPLSPSSSLEDNRITISALEKRLDYLELEMLKQVVNGSSNSPSTGDQDMFSKLTSETQDIDAMFSALKPATVQRLGTTAGNHMTNTAGSWGRMKGSALRAYNSGRSDLLASDSEPSEVNGVADAKLSARAHGLGIMLVLNVSLLILFISILLAASV